MTNLTAFLTFILLASFTPGPNNILGMTLAGRLGFWPCLRTYVFGMFIGCLLLAGLGAFFCLLLFSLIPKIEPYMRWAGAAYILWLAWIIYRDKPGQKKRAYLRPDSLLTGLLMQFLNIKGVLYVVTSFSTFIIPYSSEPFTLALFALLLSGLACAATATWAIMGVALQRVFTEHRQASNLVMALLLVYCALTLLPFWPF